MFRFVLLATTVTEMVVITLIAMNMSATAISREREDGTLDLLLTTPITPSMYLRGKLRGLISYLAPMMTVPALTLAAAGMYTLADGLGRAGGVIVSQPLGTGTIDTPVVMPAAAIVAPLVSVGFIAFVVMVGLSWSLKSRGAIGSILMTVAVVAVVTAPLGLCAYQASVGIPYAGPALACLNPGTAFFALVNPAEGATNTLEEGGVEAVRNMLLMGAPVSLGVYALIVYGMHASMLRGFDMTVRRLAGTK
jgi:ABC-type Na+ efflux pump permease subunit